MNWGNRLLLVFAAFAALIGALVYKAVHTRFDLVSDDYYKQELRYQQRIESMQNAGKLAAVSVEQGTGAVTIVLPASASGAVVEGQAWFYRKSNAEADVKIALQVDGAGRQTINKSLLVQGPYILKLDWKAGGERYYVEKDLVVN